MTDEDIFREVEEDLRREQLKLYWDKFGVYFLSVAAFIIIAVAGYKGYGAWSAQRAIDAGGEYESARSLSIQEKKDAAALAFENLVKNGPSGYKILASLQLAAAKAAKGDSKEAVKLYDKLAADSKLDPILRGFAKVQAALLRVDEADHSEMKKRLSSLNITGNYWRHSARELLGLSARKATRYKEALGYFDTIIKDSTAPSDLKNRATMMISLIKAAQKKAESGTNLEDK
ncbi:MAG: tetratricopeptide repeat protein [Methyloligellaceae bacterium]